MSEASQLASLMAAMPLRDEQNQTSLCSFRHELTSPYGQGLNYDDEYSIVFFPLNSLGTAMPSTV